MAVAVAALDVSLTTEHKTPAGGESEVYATSSFELEYFPLTLVDEFSTRLEYSWCRKFTSSLFPISSVGSFCSFPS